MVGVDDISFWVERPIFRGELLILGMGSIQNGANPWHCFGHTTHCWLSINFARTPISAAKKT